MDPIDREWRDLDLKQMIDDYEAQDLAEAWGIIDAADEAADK